MNARTFNTRQRGSALSLLLALVIIGLVAYFALRGTGTATQGSGSQQQLVNCERLMSDLIQRTGGIGPDYKTGYDAAPPACRHMLPPPGAVDSPAHQPQE
jgi:hypothetical protein